MTYQFFNTRRVQAAGLINFIVGIVLFISLVSLPLLVNVRNLNDISYAAIFEAVREFALRDAALETGMLLAAFALPLAFASTIGGWVINKIGVLRTTLLGLVVSMGGLWADVLVSGPHDP